MARNRKRAKERRSRRTPAGQASRPGVATARAERERERLDHDHEARDPEAFDDVPAAIEHAAPDAELADAQLAVGRPELAGDSDELDDEELAEEALGDDGTGAAGEALAPSAAAAPSQRGMPGRRLVTFLQGSWRELQRVQWPDRRQVMQATGVVIGFVIVAGLYLGLADTVASKLVNLILQ